MVFCRGFTDKVTSVGHHTAPDRRFITPKRHLTIFKNNLNRRNYTATVQRHTVFGRALSDACNISVQFFNSFKESPDAVRALNAPFWRRTMHLIFKWNNPTGLEGSFCFGNKLHQVLKLHTNFYTSILIYVLFSSVSIYNMVEFVRNIFIYDHRWASLSGSPLTV